MGFITPKPEGAKWPEAECNKNILSAHDITILYSRERRDRLILLDTVLHSRFQCQT